MANCVNVGLYSRMQSGETASLSLTEASVADINSIVEAGTTLNQC
jgi:hypothetical protein